MDQNINIIKSQLRTIPDFPKPGILFYDITSVLKDKVGFKACMDSMASCLAGIEFDKIAALDARGFIFGAALAERFNKGFVPIRKKGKLPGDVLSRSYNLEYGDSVLELSTFTTEPNEKFVLIDDLLATGGTAQTAIELIKEAGATVVKALFLIELTELSGRSKLGDCPIESVIQC